MRLRPFLVRFAADRRGATAIVFVMSLPIIIGMTGLGVESGYWYFKHRELQTAADVAAIAGAVEKRAGGTVSTITSSATEEAIENGYAGASGDTITVNTPPTSGSYQDSRSVEVILTANAPRFFSSIFDGEEVLIRTRGVARYEDGGEACILALAPEAAGALTFTGNALTLINGCNIMSNSLADAALIVSGSADVTVPCALSAGGVSVDEGLSLTSCSEPQTYVTPASDPFADLPEPSTVGACQTLPNGLPAETLSPGRYCGGGNVKGEKTFSAGIYVMDGGTFRINANAVVTGSEVVFFLTNGATVDFNGNATITLSAPTSGTYKGILFYSDRDNAPASNKFNGTASTSMTGAIYMPSQEVEFLGNFSGANGCLRIVSYTLKFTGSSNMNADCTAQGIGSMPLPGRVSLVE